MAGVLVCVVSAMQADNRHRNKAGRNCRQGIHADGPCPPDFLFPADGQVSQNAPDSREVRTVRSGGIQGQLTLLFRRGFGLPVALYQGCVFLFIGHLSTLL